MESAKTPAPGQSVSSPRRSTRADYCGSAKVSTVSVAITVTYCRPFT